MIKEDKSLIDVLSAISGIGKEEAGEIFERAKSNHSCLNSCSAHDFQPYEMSGKLVRSYQCIRCGGILNRVNVYWYKRGLNDAVTRVCESTL